jgi:hypothetical protein
MATCGGPNHSSDGLVQTSGIVGVVAELLDLLNQGQGVFTGDLTYALGQRACEPFLVLITGNWGP